MTDSQEAEAMERLEISEPIIATSEPEVASEPEAASEPTLEPSKPTSEAATSLPDALSPGKVPPTYDPAAVQPEYNEKEDYIDYKPQRGYNEHYGQEYHGNQGYHGGYHGNQGGYHGNQQQQYNTGHHYRQSVDEDEKFKIIVRHLNYKTTEDTVGEHFAQYGAVRTVNIKKDPDGSSRGFGFVVFESEESLSAAIAKENQRLDNHDVIVTKPIPLSEKMKTNMLFVGGLHRDITEEQLRGYFSVYGEITEIIFVENRQTQERKGFCFVHFKENEAVERITEGKNPPLAAVHNIDEFKLDCKKKFPDNHPEQRKLKQRQAAKRYFGGYGPPNGGYGPPPDYYQGGYGGYNDYNGGGGGYNGGGYEQGGYQNNYDQGYGYNNQRGRGRGNSRPY